MDDTDRYSENNFNSSSFPELCSPRVGPYISPLFSEYDNRLYRTMVCYNCLSVLLIRKDWNYVQCGECQKTNKIPRRVSKEIDYYEEPNTDLIGDIPYVYGVVNCPYCTTENKIRKEAQKVTCYDCGNSFSVNGYAERKRQRKNYASKSMPKIIQYREYIPVYQNNHDCCNNKNSTQLFLLSQILETLKQKKKPLVMYPTLFADPFGFYFRDLIESNYNNRYDNYDNYRYNNDLAKSFNSSKSNFKKESESESNGFKITIRKKNKDEEDKKHNRLSKSCAFEKVFFTNKLNDSNNYDS